MASKDYYEVLGVPKNASPEEIKRAYRKKASEHHPDRGGEEKSFKEINEAYQILSNPQKRQQYDTFGTADFRSAYGQGSPFGGFSAGGGDFSFGRGFDSFGFDFGDLFSDIFGTQEERRFRREKGVDLEMPITVSFEEAVHGTEKVITLEKNDTCPVCKGTGAVAGTKVNVCPTCHGQGEIRETRRTILGAFSSSRPCPKCEGRGKIPESPCRECRGRGQFRMPKTLKVKIPAGIEHGATLRIQHEGEVGYQETNHGDLFLRVSVASNPKFERRGNDIYSAISIPFTTAALGGEIEVETVHGKVKLKIPAGTQSGHTFRIKSKGVPRLGSSGHGDHYATVLVMTPAKLSRRAKELLTELEKEL
jgi:molecular chaperone DnaJ